MKHYHCRKKWYCIWPILGLEKQNIPRANTNYHVDY
jgi:hypothetical protein